MQKKARKFKNMPMSAAAKLGKRIADLKRENENLKERNEMLSQKIRKGLSAPALEKILDDLLDELQLLCYERDELLSTSDIQKIIDRVKRDA